MPMRSPSLFIIKSRTTPFTASSLVTIFSSFLKSRARMDSERSRARIIFTPSVVTLIFLSPNWGLARAKIKNISPAIFNIGTSFERVTMKE